MKYLGLLFLIAYLDASFEPFSYPRGPYGTCASAMILPPGIKVPKILASHKMLSFTPAFTATPSCSSLFLNVDEPLTNNGQLFFSFSFLAPKTFPQEGLGITIGLKTASNFIPSFQLAQAANGFIKLSKSDTLDKFILIPEKTPSQILIKMRRKGSFLSYEVSLNPSPSNSNPNYTDLGSDMLPMTATGPLVVNGLVVSSKSNGGFVGKNTGSFALGDVRIDDTFAATVVAGNNDLIHTFVLSGQSNMDGRAPNNDKRSKYFMTNLKNRFVEKGAMMFDVNMDQIDYFRAGVNNNCYGSGRSNDRARCVAGNKHGSELKLGVLLDDFYKNNGDVLIIKFAIGGTGLNCLKGRAYAWSTNCEFLQKKEFQLYERLMQQFVKRAYQLMTMHGWTLKFEALVWMQGEADTGGFTEKSYISSFWSLVTRMRYDLESPDMAVVLGIIGGLTSHHKPGNPGNSQGSIRVRTAQFKMQTILKRCTSVSLDDLEILVDKVHFSALGVDGMADKWMIALRPLLTDSNFKKN